MVYWGKAASEEASDWVLRWLWKTGRDVPWTDRLFQTPPIAATWTELSEENYTGRFTAVQPYDYVFTHIDLSWLRLHRWWKWMYRMSNVGGRCLVTHPVFALTSTGVHGDRDRRLVINKRLLVHALSPSQRTSVALLSIKTLRTLDLVPLTRKPTSKALGHGTRCQGISQFCLHTHARVYPRTE